MSRARESRALQRRRIELLRARAGHSKTIAVRFAWANLRYCPSNGSEVVASTGGPSQGDFRLTGQPPVPAGRRATVLSHRLAASCTVAVLHQVRPSLFCRSRSTKPCLRVAFGL